MDAQGIIAFISFVCHTAHRMIKWFYITTIDYVMLQKNHWKPLVLIVSLMLGMLTRSAQAQTSGLDYSTNGSVITLTGYSGTPVNVIIPNFVTIIGALAFENCTSLTNVTMDTNVTNIGQGAFYNCTNLTSVIIPDSIISIGSSSGGNGAFASCTKLTNVTIGTNVTYIGTDTFADCSNLTSVTIPNSVGVIDVGVFYNCTSLTNVTMGTNVASIGVSAFLECANLTGITLPDSVTNIGNEAFESCSSLTSINIPNGVTSIGDETFLSCSSLTSINIPSGVTSIGGVAFGGCTSLTCSVTIPSGLTSMGVSAFQGCPNLISVLFEGNFPYVDDFGGELSISLSAGDVFLGDSPTIYYLAGTTGWSSGSAGYPVTEFPFDWATNGNAITITGYTCSDGAVPTIPTSINNLPVTSIGEIAFQNCASLTSVIIPNSVTSIEELAFQNCASLTNVTMPDSVTNIGQFAFIGCSSLPGIVIPDSVTSIGEFAFYDCTSLTSLYFYGNAPTADSSVFSSSFSSNDPVTIYFLPGTAGWTSTFAGRPTALWTPLIQASGPNFGVQAGEFGFNISWATNQSVVVEACTNLANPVWQPLQTNTLTIGSLSFNDPKWTNYAARFYRVRTP